MLQMRKDNGIFSSVGVQTLVLNELRSVPTSGQVLVLGQGDIGGAVLAALHREGFSKARTYGRADLPQLQLDAPTADAVVVCTGAPRAHLCLPQPVAGARPVVVDVGSPAQLLDAPGWRCIGLDELLTRRSLTADAPTLASLQLLADDGAVAIEESLDESGHHRVLEVLETEKKRFFQDDVTGLVAALPPKEARRVTAHLRGFTHRLLEATRRAARDS
jgi:glutamyl-tRNA reductase